MTTSILAWLCLLPILIPWAWPTNSHALIYLQDQKMSSKVTCSNQSKHSKDSNQVLGIHILLFWFLNSNLLYLLHFNWSAYEIDSLHFSCEITLLRLEFPICKPKLLEKRTRITCMLTTLYAEILASGKAAIIFLAT